MRINPGIDTPSRENHPTGQAVQVLVVAADPAEMRLVNRSLTNDRRTRFSLAHAPTLANARQHLAEAAIDVVLLDLDLPDGQGLECLQQIIEVAPEAAVLVLTEPDDEDLALAALQLGAQDNLIKGRLAGDELGRRIRQARVRRRMLADLAGRGLQTGPGEAVARQTQAAAHEQRFRSLIENSTDGITLLDTHGTVIYDSPAAPGLLGYEANGLVGQNAFEHIHPDDLPKVQALFQQMLDRPQELTRGQFRFRHRDGSWRWLEGTGRNLLADPVVAAVVINYSDITERKEAEAAQRAAEARYRTLVEQLPAATYIDEISASDPTQFRPAYASPQFETLLGYRADELMADPSLWATLIHPDDRESTLAAYGRHYAGDGELSHEYRLITRDGRVVWVHDEAVLVAGSSRDTRLSQGVLFDITERKRVEGELRLASEILNSVHTVVIVAGSQGQIIFASPSVRTILGIAPEEILGDGWWEFSRFDPVERERDKSAVARIARGETEFTEEPYEKSICTRQGDARWIEWQDVRGPDQTLIGVGRDITERKWAEAERSKAVQLLADRLKELMLLHHAARLFQSDVAPVREVLTGVVNSLPEAWQFPEAAAARISVGTLTVTTPSYADSPWRQRAEFTTADGQKGWVEVVYLEERPTYAEGPFLAEERSTINTLADMLRAFFDRRAAQTALRDSEAFGRATLSSLASNIAVLDSAGNIVSVNQAWERFARDNGASPGAAGVGVSYLEVCRRAAEAGDEVAGQALAGLQSVMAGEAETFVMEYPCPSPEVQRWFVLRVSPMLNAAGGVVAAHQDVSQRRQAEAETRRRAEELEALLENSRGLAAQHDLTALLNTLVERAMRLLNAQAGSVYLYDPDRQELEMFVAIGLPVAPGLRLQAGEGLAGRSAETLQPIVVNDYQSWPGKSAQFDDNPLQAMVQVPMLYAGELVGVLGVAQTTARHQFTEAEVRLLVLFAGQAAAAVSGARQVAAMQQRLAELEAINRVSGAMRRAHTLDEMLPLLLDETLAVLSTDVGNIRLYDPASDELQLGVVRGWLGSRNIGSAEGISGHVFQTGQPYVAPSLGRDPYWFAGPESEEAQNWAGLCVPIHTASQAVGVLIAAARLPRQFTPDEVRLLTTLAEMAGSAIHRMRLYKQTEERLLRLSALRSMEVAISSSLDVRVTLDVLLDQVNSALAASAAALLTLSPITQVLEFAAGRGFQGLGIHRSHMRLGQGLAGRAALERRTLVLAAGAPIDEAPDRATLLKSEGFVTHFATPLVAKGEVKGVLEAFHRTPMRPDPEWIEFFEALAGQAAIAIDSAQLFDSLQRSNLELALAYDATIEGWARALDLRDQRPEDRTWRVVDRTLQVARLAGIPEAESVHLRRGALLHDIGQMAIPDSILLKPGPLTEAEWALVRRHPQAAADLLAPIAFLRPALDIPLYHHERWDGSGYPKGLKGFEIPLAARIFAVVDVWEALLSDRPYRAAWPVEKARAHLRDEAGHLFDPEIVETFLPLVDTSP